MHNSKKLCATDDFSHKDNNGFSYFNFLEFKGKTFLFSGGYLGEGSRNKIYKASIEARDGHFKENNFS